MPDTAVQDLLGEHLLEGTMTLNTANILHSAKYVGIYFSAHWCSPCRAFTPKLASSYNEHLKNDGIEIVFVSEDKTEAEFKDYFKEMPWKAVPYDSSVRGNLKTKFKIDTIPKLVILSPDGKVVCQDGVKAIKDDPTGKSLLPGAKKGWKQKCSKCTIM
uniref:Thioredoxin domain-containing protein n=1 Tax=Eutreptiella gymnastica TaxID=73025 RepID=A0A7S4LGY3_9EUGL|eukprot:CAMPEP_0174302798 /NCGR_PEP_ID=MMETSP0809-20121228/59818_1 /TAXON_ID=73025 ORGANISM="Eutreptiella gymnastica-like, Strain CCMP1594" /NCGR_SAMPLE_ID=MMETSP0809 /ASSEMBLY_ACC=CAM_ASM_000658 /LENGTH=158 /DNA_ID=CAMNT_0015408729 /DNA_START=23 /DNA_END=499 /DNA_ORIENTATION=+